ncbi:hypothetical protein LA345_38740 (plasmid) [Burkholderia vietnamiensis]|uniref:Uncharacterized protein n=1 Tax=Burkholderia vietnamiensis (strain G4 / LMG 22486) TaxID=269482 RepID=A4JWB1_BURVG|nr:hypothetical protein Bcep1808_7694 [Burkholderia vietnamiensis G4]MCB4349736.1 hypothetical protein [Burkholderia vietnamiensis]
MTTRTLIVLGPAALGAAIARSLADGSVIVTADDFGRVRERYAEPVKVEARDYDYERESEVAHLRRENRWRERRNNAHINTRIKAQQRGAR